MKKVMTNLIIAAAAFVAVAGVASAQTMEAKVPFAFRASGKMLAAGTYRVTMNRTASGGELVVIRNQDTGQDVLTVGSPSGNAASGGAALSFECGVTHCALHEIRTGGTSAYAIPTPSLGKDEPATTATVTMHQVKAD